MTGTPSLLAPGVRTADRAGFGTGLAMALSVVLGTPSLWLLGALGFAARGGLLVLALPILSLPSPAALRPILGEAITSTGISAGLQGLVAIGIVALIVLVGAGLVASALADLAAFERFVGDAETEDLRGGRPPRAISRAERRRLVGSLLAIQVAVLVPAAVAIVAAAHATTAVAIRELQLPSSLERSLVDRVLGGASREVIAVAVLLVAGEILGSLATRRLLASTFDLDAAHSGTPRTGWRSPIAFLAAAGGWPVRHPLRTLATVGATWLVTLSLLLPIVATMGVAWGAVRGVFLSSAGLGEPEFGIRAGIVTLVFAALWVAATLIAGFASALRAAIWSADALR